jgi:hypothetical protein
MVAQQNANLRRDSFGNQSFKTGLNQLANADSRNSGDSWMNSSRTQDCRRHATSNHDLAGWGFFADE